MLFRDVMKFITAYIQPSSPSIASSFNNMYVYKITAHQTLSCMKPHEIAI